MGEKKSYVYKEFTVKFTLGFRLLLKLLRLHVFFTLAIFSTGSEETPNFVCMVAVTMDILKDCSPPHF